MRPDRHPTFDRPRWLDQFRAADFVVTGWRQASDDEISLLVMDEESVFLRDNKGVPPAALASRIECFPKTVSVGRVEAPELAVATD